MSLQAKYNSNGSGFSLLEILVVMAILAILMAMLSRAITNFRQTSELQQVNDQIMSGINETKSYVNNNVLPKDINIQSTYIYAYQLTISDDKTNIIRKICSFDTNLPMNADAWDCDISTRKDNLLSNQFKNIELSYSDECNGVLLINLTGDWQYLSKTDNSYKDSGSCKFLLRNNKSAKIFRKFVFDTTNNSFELEYGD